MRKFFTLILILIAGLISEAQPTYYNHATTAGGTTNVFPFSANAAVGKRVQWVIAAGEFNQPSSAPAGNLTTLWFWANTAGSATYTNLTVRMAMVSTSTFIQTGQFYTGAMTTVRQQNTAVTPSGANTWVSIPLTTPFAYNPTMNLIIEVYHCGYTGGGFSLRQIGYGSAPNYRRQYSDASSACGAVALPTGGDLNIAGIGVTMAAANPSVTIDQAVAQADPTSTSPINFTAVFNQPVTGFATGDVTLSGTAGATTAVVTGGPSTYNVAVSGMTGSGTVIATIAAGVCVNATNDPNNASTSTDNTVTYNLPAATICTTFVGNVSAADPSTSLRSFRDAINKTCASPGTCQAGLAGTFQYKILTWTNPIATPQCVTIDYSIPNANANFSFVTAFNGPPNLANLCTNWLSDPGSSATVGNTITFSFNVPGSATVNFLVTNVTGGQTVDYSIVVKAPICSANPCTINRTSAAGTDNQSLCLGAPITNITYATTIATGATFTGLPAGVTGNWASNVVTISGTPTTAGVYNYTVTLVGCPSATTATGTITVNANPQIGIIDDPTGPLCQGDPKRLTAVLGIPLVNYCFTHSSSTTITSGNSVACNAGGITTDNSYWRVYPLTGYALPGPLTITSVKFGVEINQNAPLNATVRLYTQSGAAFPGGTRTLIRTQAVTIPIMSAAIFTAPITPVTVNPTDIVVVELFTPNVPGVSRFWIGSNAAAQTSPSYLSAVPCGIATPTDIAAIGFPNMHIILDICGTTGGGGTPIPAGWTFLWSPAAGLSSTNTNPVAASPAVSTTYTVVVTNLNGCVGNASIPITVNTRPSITTQPANTTVCHGQTASFTAGGAGTGFVYQWQESTNGGVSWNNLTNAAPYSGVTTATLTINPATVAMNGYRYRVAVSGACPPIAYSNGALLNVNALPVISISPAGPVCGGVAGISGLALTASGANTYVWAPVTGLYTNAIATIPYTGTNLATVYAAPTTLTAYTVTGTTTSTGCSNSASVVVNYTPPPPTVTPNPVVMCLGDPAVKLKSSTSQSYTASFASGAVNVAIPDGPTIPPVPASYPATSSNITVSGIPAGAIVTGVRARMNITHAWVADLIIALKAPNGNVYNLDALLSGTNNPGANFTNTIISSSGATALSAGAAPWSATFRADGAGATFVALGFTFPGGPAGFVPNVASWSGLYSVPNGTWTLAMYDAGAPDGGTFNNWTLDIDYILGVPASPATWSPAGGLFSDAGATVPYVAGTQVDSVWTRPTPAGVYNYNVTVQSLSAPPAAVTTPMAGGNANNMIFFNLTNGNGIPMNLNGISSNAWTNGAVTARLYVKTSPIAGNPGLINAANGWNVIGTNNLTVTANTLNAVLTGLAFPIPAGATYGIGLEFTGASFPAYTNGAGIVTYTNNGCTITTGGNVGWAGPVAPGPPANNPRNFNGAVYLSAANVPACTSPARVVTVTVNTQATVTVQPVNQTVCTDKVATFSVTATIPLGTIAYQWEVSTDNGNTYTAISNNTIYSGATTPTLTITRPPVSMNGYMYRCRLQGPAPCTPAYSFFRILTVNPLPTVVISASPYVKLFPGLRTVLSSTVSPVAAATYTWRRNGGVVGGANTGTLNVDVDGLGDYTLTVTDINGCTNTSNLISITDSVMTNCFLYPNPSNGRFQVRYHSVANNVLPRYLTVYDAKGARILAQQFSIVAPYSRMDLDLRPYGKGVFWVELGDRNGSRITMCRAVVE